MSEPIETLIDQLTSLSSIDRLRSARLLKQRELSAPQRSELQRLLRQEEDAWVRSALSDAVDSAGEGDASARQTTSDAQENWGLVDEQTLSDVRAQAIATVTSTLLHEIRPQVGLMEVAAASEIVDYQDSHTRASLERLRSFLNTVQRLGDASRPPQPIDFDLTSAIYECTEEAVPNGALQLARSDPQNSYGDWDLIRLALLNAVRNARDATADNGGKIVVNWGITDQDSWIVVLDEGVGLPMGHDFFAPGYTTKSRATNQGWGLAIAMQAIQSAGGSMRLRPREGAGAACEIRWPGGLT